MSSATSDFLPSQQWGMPRGLPPSPAKRLRPRARGRKRSGLSIAQIKQLYPNTWGLFLSGAVCGFRPGDLETAEWM